MADKFSHEFLKEKYERHRQQFLRCGVVKKHVPNIKASPVTSKFYSKHQQSIENDVDRKCIQYIDEKLYSVPKDRYRTPILENQKYGWLSEPLMKHDKYDQRMFFHPKKKHEITDIGGTISQEKITQRPSFNGLKFKLVV